MDNSQLKAKLLWRCRRGMKELDVLMQRYVEEKYFQSTDKQKAAFEQLLQMQDPDLYGLILGRIEDADKDIMYVVSTLTEYHQS